MRPFAWWLSIIVFITIMSVAAMLVAANGLLASWPVLVVVAAPFAVYVLATNRSLPGMITIVVTLGAAAIANIVVWLTSPLSAPIFETLGYALSTGVVVVASGALVCRWLSPITPRPTLLGLFGLLAIGSYFFVASLAAPTAFAVGPFAFLMGAVVCGVPLFILVATGAKARTRWKRIVYFVFAALVALWTFSATVTLFFNAYAMLSDVHVSRYQLTLEFDENEQNFVANEWLQADFDWRDDSDVVRDAEGRPAGWDQQIAMQEALERVGLQQFTTVAAVLGEGTPDPNAPPPEAFNTSTTHVALRMERRSSIPSQQDGLLFRTGQFQLPSALGLTPAVAARPPEVMQIQIDVPENFGLEHNLSGTARRVVDPNGRASIQIYGREVEDVWGTLMLRYPIKPLRTAYLSDLAHLAGNRLAQAGLAIVLGTLFLWTAIIATKRWTQRQSGPRVFINYRRGDEPGFAQALFQYLERALPTARVFMDVSGGLDPGDDFSAVLRASVDECDVLLAVIGPAWADVRDEKGQRRLEDNNDWVRREIATALEHKKLVIPILVGGAPMPKPVDLPDVLRALRGKQAVELRTLTFKVDAQHLVQFLAGYRKATTQRSRAPA